MHADPVSRDFSRSYHRTAEWRERSWSTIDDSLLRPLHRSERRRISGA